MSTPHVVVIGAGCAGLSAATALAEAGLGVTVVEARPMAGGRTFATRDTASGAWVDNGQHVLFGCYHDTLDYVARIGTRDRLRVQASLAVPMIEENGRRSELRCPALPSPLQLVAGVLAWDTLTWSERFAVAGMGRALAPGAVPLPGETVRQWLMRYGQPARLIALLWEPLAVAALNQSIDDATATTFVEVIRRMLGPGPDDASLVIPAASLSHVLIEPALDFVTARGGEVMLGGVAKLVVRDGCVAGVTVRGRRLDAQAVISAVPWHALAAMFEDVPPAAQDLVRHASSMGHAPIVTANLWFDRDVLDAPFIGLPGRRFQWAFDTRRLTGGRAAHVSLVCSGATDVVDLDNAAIIEIAHRELATAIPAAGQAQLLRGTAVRERRATFSLAPGQPPRPGTITGLPGLLLAGDWTDTGLPATIESAVISGHRAARAALEHLAGPSPQPPAPRLP